MRELSLSLSLSHRLPLSSARRPTREIPMSQTLLQSLQVALQTANTQALDEISRLASHTSINEALDHSADGMQIIINNTTRLTDLDPLAVILYKELAYRHLYTKSSPDLNDRIGSFNNYCELFNHILSKHIFRKQRVIPTTVELEHSSSA